MLKQILTAASVSLLLAGAAHADDDPSRSKPPRASEPKAAQNAAKKPPTFTVRPDRREDGGRGDDRGRGRDRGHDRDDGHDRGHDRRDDEHRDWGDRRDDDRRDWRDRDRHDDWRDHDRRDDGHRGWDRNDWRRDDDWRRRGWRYDGWRNDGWLHYRGHDSRHWRYVPPVRYRLDFGYRSGYELAWRDWLSYGIHDRSWRRRSTVGYGTWRAGYDAGWRDAAFYYGRGYRPNYWSYDPYGGWFFSFSITG